MTGRSWSWWLFLTLVWCQYDFNTRTTAGGKVNISCLAGPVNGPSGVASEVTDYYDGRSGQRAGAGARMACESEEIIMSDLNMELLYMTVGLGLMLGGCFAVVLLVNLLLHVVLTLLRKLVTWYWGY